MISVGSGKTQKEAVLAPNPGDPYQAGKLEHPHPKQEAHTHASTLSSAGAGSWLLAAVIRGRRWMGSLAEGRAHRLWKGRAV